MSQLLPDREDLRRALRWIAECRAEKDAAPLSKLIDQASQRFDLSPADQEFLFHALAPPRPGDGGTAER